MKLGDLIENRPQQAVTSVVHKPANTCHSSADFDFVYGSPRFLFRVWNIYAHGGRGAAGPTSRNEIKKTDFVDLIISWLHLIGSSA